MVPRLQELTDFSVLVVGHRKVDLSGCRLDGKQIIELERTGQSAGQARFEGLCW